MTSPHSCDRSLCWINRLEPAQLALTRTIQEHGLLGQWIGAAEFAWLLNGELLVTSGPQASLSDAFDLAVQQLPRVYTTFPS
ncbi:hypothetical protein ACFFLM_04860 [Deinococcus oregonensis]|uniref:Uncharacterized protein n=1 Tax=Deinococcus oregonensis TaxID=1805970 RepID=A0ABV6AUW9_9DEIO